MTGVQTCALPIFEDIPAGQTASEEAAAEEVPVEEKVTAEAPAEDVPVGQTASEEAADAEATVEEVPTEEATAETEE